MTKAEKEQLVLLLNKAIEEEVLLADMGLWFEDFEYQEAVLDEDGDIIIKEIKEWNEQNIIKTKEQQNSLATN